MVMKSEAQICAIICLCLVLSRVTSLPGLEDSDTDTDIDPEIVGGVKLHKSSSIGGTGVLGAPIVNPLQQPPSGNCRLVRQRGRPCKIICSGSVCSGSVRQCNAVRKCTGKG
eukprot:GFUD01016925.1.p1 GENE.GFUD01016925.1~~GFUD01016925.1.p1  ORF type:complete len:112 (+),score=16.07 GFUD01016925.1:198-533(+)